jgi:hypothetical protein
VEEVLRPEGGDADGEEDAADMAEEEHWAYSVQRNGKLRRQHIRDCETAEELACFGVR